MKIAIVFTQAVEKKIHINRKWYREEEKKTNQKINCKCIKEK